MSIPENKRLHPVVEYITLEGEDYNLCRAREAEQRKEFCKPENHQQRVEELKSLTGGKIKIDWNAKQTKPKKAIPFHF